MRVSIGPRLIILWTQFLAAGVAVSAYAAGEYAYPYIESDVLIEIQNDWTYDSDDRDVELNDLFTKTEPTIALRATPEISFVVHGVLEPALAPRPHKNRAFEDHGLFIEDAYAEYATDRFAVRGGKFTPNFGLAWDVAPGVYGTDFAEGGYEFTERIGFGGSVTFANQRIGTHTLSASSFFLDTSVLADSVLRDRNAVGKEGGGVSNTEDLSSFAIGIDGGELSFAKGFSYHVAGIHQAEGVDGETAETGFVLGGQYGFSAGEFEFVPFIEFVHFDDADGIKGQERQFLTTSLQMNWQRWNLALSRTGRETNLRSGAEIDDFMLQLSAGYEFDTGLAVDIGWRKSEESAVDTEILGVLVAFELNF